MMRFLSYAVGIALCVGVCIASEDYGSCPMELQSVACECGELAYWDPVPRVTGYEIQRCWVGSRFKKRFDEPRWCEIVGRTTLTEWHFADERPERRRLNKALMRYRVRSVRGYDVSEWSAEYVEFKRGRCND